MNRKFIKKKGSAEPKNSRISKRFDKPNRLKPESNSKYQGLEFKKPPKLFVGVNADTQNKWLLGFREKSVYRFLVEYRSLLP